MSFVRQCDFCKTLADSIFAPEWIDAIEEGNEFKVPLPSKQRGGMGGDFPLPSSGAFASFQPAKSGIDLVTAMRSRHFCNHEHMLKYLERQFSTRTSNPNPASQPDSNTKEASKDE